ncbi:hypothetical protein A7985_01840 [Pseudoalteromonas luteoviolacea]|uniref:Lipoprotein n=1 Tax=Pseudoalteromonas luteoviolacea TaxID=43657 RepID=A0A1C0TU09_9GAMM|nr:hypothetical protein [Pseudoalteromonas luteoviolacea]MBQ4811246.1 hypothetical protein [Pseudoalteromonas luteoviolacea]OCQ22724.1 hypothetical protein A7985_01840 [Pseudoalteromonas luteoviolacea]
MIRIKKLLVSLVTIAALAGCKSPKRDDYVVAKSLNKDDVIEQSEFKFYLDLNAPVEIRGEYSHDRSIDSAQVMYYGTPGAALVQVFSHAAINSSLKEQRLKEQQEEANRYIGPLIEASKQVTHVTLTEDMSDYVVKQLPVAGDKTVNVKPIFFSNQDMNKLSLKLIAWIEKPKSSKTKSRKKLSNLMYQNIIEVHGSTWSEETATALMDGQADIADHYEALFVRAVESLKKDLSGTYSQTPQQQTLHIKKKNTKQFLRASVIEQSCEYVVIKNLRNWILHYPASYVTNIQNQC